MASGKSDEVKGRIKEATGALTGDKELKRESKIDQAADKAFKRDLLSMTGYGCYGKPLRRAPRRAHETRNSLRRAWCACTALALLLLLPIAAQAAVDVDPGTTASGLAADGGNVLEQCAPTASETCTVAINAVANEVGASVDATADGAGVASGEVFSDFSVTGNAGGALVGSLLSAVVDVDGLLSALASDALASAQVSLRVTDMTAGVLVGAQTVLSQAVANGSVPVVQSTPVAMPLPLTAGHDYRVSLVLETEAAGSAGAAVGSLSDFATTASWSDLSVTAGQDPFAPIAALDGRVTQLESNVARLANALNELASDVDVLQALVDRIANALRDLQQTVAQLREDFDNHTHTYLTGRGVGHNNTEASTTTPLDGDGPQASLPPYGNGNSVNDDESSQSSKSVKKSSKSSKKVKRSSEANSRPRR